MNLIEELGLEKCKQIVEGAPAQTSHINIYGDCIYMESKHQMYVFSVELGWTHYHQREEMFSLDRVRTTITNHDLTVSNLSQNDKQADLSIKKDMEDHCSDIRNHISPNTKVIER